MPMRRAFILAVAMLAGMATARAQADKVAVAQGTAQSILTELAGSIVATEVCGVGDRQVWEKVVAAIDRRYRFCVAKDPSWSALLGSLAEDEKKSVAAGSSRSFASFVIEDGIGQVRAIAKSAGKAAFCDARPWKMMASPDTATPGDKAEFMKTHPDYPLTPSLDLAGFTLHLGNDPSWIEGPCDKFWPLTYR
jgi:hypothetical protein